MHVKVEEICELATGILKKKSERGITGISTLGRTPSSTHFSQQNIQFSPIKT